MRRRWAPRVVSREVALAPSLALRAETAERSIRYRACLGLAAAAAKRGATLFERSPVRRITFNRKFADVFTAGGAIRTRKVIIATGLPTPQLHKSLRRHFCSERRTSRSPTLCRPESGSSWASGRRSCATPPIPTTSFAGSTMSG